MAKIKYFPQDVNVGRQKVAPIKRISLVTSYSNSKNPTFILFINTPLTLTLGATMPCIVLRLIICFKNRVFIWLVCLSKYKNSNFIPYSQLNKLFRIGRQRWAPGCSSYKKRISLVTSYSNSQKPTFIQSINSPLTLTLGARMRWLNLPGRQHVAPIKKD